MANQFPIDVLNDVETKNWTKVGVSFYETKDGIVPLVAVEWSVQNSKPNQKSASETDIYYLLKFICKHKQVYKDKEFQKAANNVKGDRNDYIHHLPEAKVTYKQLEQWTGDMLDLLKLVQKQELAGTASHAMERIEKIRKANYEIVQEDERMARLSNLEGEIVRLERIVQTHEEGLKSIKDCLQDPEYSGVDSTLGGIIKRKIDKVETDLKESMSSLESTVEEINDRVDYLIEKNPDIQEEKSANIFVESLKTSQGWNPKSDEAIKHLVESATEGKFLQCKLLLNEGVQMEMKHLPGVMYGKVSLEILRLVIEHMKDSHRWDSMCRDASEALECCIGLNRTDLQDELTYNGINIECGINLDELSE